ncbi:Cyclopropane-fatty-acyl-phospholipid synthase [Denitrovibrio acetiphilus DSM 12809]|uniref:Cyclopropane-fatty-acyl-phospholipid synthase n=1 Tax=Denitrovibrio acetiphilus (strain DSM 12809 / NBRC 114555 / N2460) TaxID=522772 RepID=D4H0Q4_DENA2|nr:cyclopropane fatty acyl phospholipid synthase [Denitrovibrio acetiphilus]ADD68567.1 Cyclopropane-fatty-acyl-phospholipid synthase [Denitrovibrio acetiphilus DSM 12809]
MSSIDFKTKIEHALSTADIKTKGDRPWDITIHNDNLFSRVMADGSLGLGEAYIEKWWDCDKLDEFFYRILSVELETQFKSWTDYKEYLRSKLFNLQNRSRAFQIGQKHYDIGNELYKNMLDERLIYSCGYWSHANNLKEAQESKLDLVCRKLQLKPGMRILDIGCGWGGADKFAAENYGVEVVGITVSKEQVELGKCICSGLPVNLELKDYRDISEKFDRIFSIGMFEHVGRKNYKEYFEVAKRCLKDDEIFLLHTIGRNTTSKGSDPWISKYIFPNSMLPSAKDIAEFSEGQFVIEDWHNFGQYYDTTLMEWYRNFNKNWDKLKDKYDENFYRMWKYYLLSCAGSFRARKNQVWQIVFSPKGIKGGYEPVR